MRRCQQMGFRMEGHVERDANWPPRGQKFMDFGRRERLNACSDRLASEAEEKTTGAIVREVDGEAHCLCDETGRGRLKNGSKIMRMEDINIIDVGGKTGGRGTFQIWKK